MNISIFFILFILDVLFIMYYSSTINFFKIDMQVKDLEYYHTFLLIYSAISI